MKTDWIKLKLGKDWGDGEDTVWVRVAEIQAITDSIEHPGESIIYLSSENAFDVVGLSDEIMEMINARAGA